MTYKSIFIFLVLILSCLGTTSASEENVIARVVRLHGQVFGKLPDGKKFKVVADQKITEGTELVTSGASFLRLVFIDKSVTNLGPSSSMIIKAFPKNDAGIIGAAMYAKMHQ